MNNLNYVKHCDCFTLFNNQKNHYFMSKSCLTLFNNDFPIYLSIYLSNVKLNNIKHYSNTIISIPQIKCFTLFNNER